VVLDENAAFLALPHGAVKTRQERMEVQNGDVLPNFAHRISRHESPLESHSGVARAGRDFTAGSAFRPAGTRTREAVWADGFPENARRSARL